MPSTIFTVLTRMSPSHVMHVIIVFIKNIQYLLSRDCAEPVFFSLARLDHSRHFLVNCLLLHLLITSSFDSPCLIEQPNEYLLIIIYVGRKEEDRCYPNCVGPLPVPDQFKQIRQSKTIILNSYPLQCALRQIARVKPMRLPNKRLLLM